MRTRRARTDDLDAWAGMRHDLWPDSEPDELRAEAERILSSEDEVCFVAVHPSSGHVGFAEACVHPGPEGPYAHLEGWFVKPEFAGAPIAYGVTVPANSPNAELAAEFVAFLVGQEGRAIMERNEHPVLVPPVADNPDAVPASLRELIASQ